MIGGDAAPQTVAYFGHPYSGHDSGSYDPGYPSHDYDSCPDDSGYPSGDYDFCSDNSGKLSIPDGRVKAAASMELSHLRGQRGRYASSDEQRHWQRQTSSLRTGVSVAEAAKRSCIVSIGGKFAYASSTAGGVCWSAHYPSYATTSRCREPSASTMTRCYVGSIRLRGVGTWFLSGLRAEGCACSLDGGYSTTWIAYGSFRPFGSGRIVHGKGTPTCNPCSRCRLEGAFGHRTVCCSPCLGSLKVDFLSQGA